MAGEFSSLGEVHDGGEYYGGATLFRSFSPFFLNLFFIIIPLLIF